MSASTRTKLCPDDHAHNNTCYSAHGCRCQPCKDVHAEYQRRYKKTLPPAGRRLAPAWPAVRRVRYLYAKGWPPKNISQLSGVSIAIVGDLVHARRQFVTPQVGIKIVKAYEKLSGLNPIEHGADPRVSGICRSRGLDRCWDAPIVLQ